MAAIVARDLTLDYEGKRVLDHADLSVEPGEILCVSGPSGEGKSTLLRVLGGLERPSQGSIRIFDRDCDMVRPSPLDEARDDLGFVFQNCALISNMTVYNNILLPLKFRRDRIRANRRVLRSWRLAPSRLPGLGADRMSDRDLAETAEQALRNMLIYDYRNSFPHEISLGMQKRVAVARAMVLNPRALLLDEPTSGLDLLSRQSLVALVSNLNKLRKVTVVVVTHDLDLARTLDARISILSRGKLTEPRPYDRLRELDLPFVRELFAEHLDENGGSDHKMMTDAEISAELRRRGEFSD